MRRNNKKTEKICLLGATFVTGNMGIAALTAGVIKTIAHSFPGAEVCLLDYGKESLIYDLPVNGRGIKVKLLNMRFSKKFYLKNNISVLLLMALAARYMPIKAMRNKIISKSPIIREVEGSDIVASIAGGDSFSDIYGLKRFFYVSLPQLLAVFMGKDLILLPQTLGPFRGRIPSAVARYIMKKAKAVYSRDTSGLEEMRGFMAGGYSSGKFRFSYDMGFVLDPIKPDKMDLSGFSEMRGAGSPAVGLNISGLLAMGGYTRDNMFGLKADYMGLVYELIDRFIKEKGADVILIPHVFGSEGESDSIICEKVYGELKERYSGKLFIVRGRYDQGEIKYIIGLCDFFIGSRMHACIAALSQNIPAVAIAYSKKFMGVLESIGVGQLVADLSKSGKEDVLRTAMEAFDGREGIRMELEKRIPRIKNSILDIFGSANPS